MARSRRHRSRGAGTSSIVEYSPTAIKKAKRKRQRQQERLDAKCARLAGPVIITYLDDPRRAD